LALLEAGVGAAAFTDRCAAPGRHRCAGTLGIR
jgi:hypothetical protein